MEHEILDTPFNDSFNDFLEKGETIIWTGKPQGSYSLDRFEITILVFLLFLLFFSWTSSKDTFIFIIAIIVFFSWLIFTSKRKDIHEEQNTVYALTQKRIFYEFKNKNTSKVFFIPIKNIKAVRVTQNIIYIDTKRSEVIPFDVFEFHEPTRRRKHQLRDIDQIKLVAQLIQNEMIKIKK